MKLNRRFFLFGAAAAPVVAAAKPVIHTNGAPPRKPAQVGLLPYQRRVIDATESEILLYGGRGAGKTHTCLEWHRRHSREPGYCGLHVCSHVSQEHRKRLESLGAKPFVDGVYEFPGGSRVQVASSKRNTIGCSFSHISFDDAEHYLSAYGYLSARSTLRQPGIKKQVLFTAGGSGPDLGWLHRHFAQPDPDRLAIHVTMFDNPHVADRYHLIGDAGL